MHWHRSLRPRFTWRFLLVDDEAPRHTLCQMMHGPPWWCSRLYARPQRRLRASKRCRPAFSFWPTPSASAEATRRRASWVARHVRPRTWGPGTQGRASTPAGCFSPFLLSSFAPCRPDGCRMRVSVLDIASPTAAVMLEEPRLWPQIVSSSNTVPDLKADLVQQRVARDMNFNSHPTRCTFAWSRPLSLLLQHLRGGSQSRATSPSRPP